ncbi:MAG: hypothetical protein AB7O57_06610 [Hyphomicrobiaceae bacterium]
MAILNGTNGIPDTLVGGDGDDIIYGYDSASGSLGGITDSDSLSGGAGNDWIEGGEGADTIDGGAGADSLVGGDQNDVIRTGGNNLPSVMDVAWGGAGDDTIIAGVGKVYIQGDEGNDFIDLTAAGTVSNRSVYAGTGNDLVLGGDGIDQIFGDAGNDTIYGGAGDDHIYSREVGDTDVLDGGDGRDFLHLARLSLTTGLDLVLGDPAEQVTLPDGTTFVGFEAFMIDAGTGDDTLTGTAFSAGSYYSFDGGPGNDSLTAAVGDSRLYGGDGNDTLTGFYCYGEWGNDTIIAAAGGADYVAQGGEGDDYIDMSAASPGALHNIYADSGNDTIIGSAGADVIRCGWNGSGLVDGGGGDDNLLGDNGNDTLIGGANNDYLYGGQGDDLFIASGALDGVDLLLGLQGINTADYSVLGAANGIAVGLFGADYVSLIVTGGDTDQLRNIANVTGGGGSDNISGDWLSNVLVGNGSSDSLTGNGAADTLLGGDGDDFLFIDHLDTSIRGGAGYDAVLVQDTTGTSLDVGAAEVEWVYGWTGNDTLDASSSTLGVALVGEAGADRLTGSAQTDYVYMDSLDTVDCGAGYDALIVYQGNGQAVTDTTVDAAALDAEWVLGGAGNDTLTNTGSAVSVALSGGAGDDTISGGLGNDYLFGNAGADVFVVTANAQFDAVLDFENGADRIDVAAAGFTTFAQVQAAASDIGGTSTLLDLGSGNQLLLYGFAIGQLDATDIRF